MAGLSRFGITPDADEAVGQQAGKGDMLAHPDDNVVSIVDTGTTFPSVSTIPVGQVPTGLDVSPDGRHLCVAQLSLRTGT